uniref:Coiled-coil domain containing 3 n=1 Tax=Laticauda laticaudata TaxID=8630 RepID=A0A8C5SAU9_LATLA
LSPPQANLLLSLLLLLGEQLRPSLACQLPTDWRPLSEGCRAELAATIVYAKVLALHQDMYYSMYNYLPWHYDAAVDGGLFYSAEIEMLCDQAWGSMLEVPAGSRFNLTGLGYFSCHSHTVMQDYSYFFFLRMDENYNLLPHGVNFQDAIFPDTQENRQIFSSLFQFSNCSQGLHAIMFSSDWETQEDNRVRNLSTFVPLLFLCHTLGHHTGFIVLPRNQLSNRRLSDAIFSIFSSMRFFILQIMVVLKMLFPPKSTGLCFSLKRFHFSSKKLLQFGVKGGGW